MKHKKLKPLNVARFKKLALALVIVSIAVLCYTKAQPHTEEAKQKRQLEFRTQQLKNTIKQLEQQKNVDHEHQKQLQDTQKQLQDTQKQLEAKRNAQTAYAAEVAQQAVQEAQPPAYTAPANTAPSGCGDNTYANFIYMHESGCRTNAVNEIGACGIGQAYPCGKMACSLSDYSCQNQFFTNYANARYGGWYPAYVYWVAHRVW